METYPWEFRTEITAYRRNDDGGTFDASEKSYIRTSIPIIHLHLNVRAELCRGRSNGVAAREQQNLALAGSEVDLSFTWCKKSKMHVVSGT